MWEGARTSSFWVWPRFWKHSGVGHFPVGRSYAAAPTSILRPLRWLPRCSAPPPPSSADRTRGRGPSPGAPASPPSRAPASSVLGLGGGGGGVVEPKACCVAHMRTEAALEKLNENLCVMEKDIGTLLEHERRLERSEQFHKRLSYVLIPGAAAFFVFCPDKKREPSTEGQLGV
ncbi:uncharacterized protein [Triticum aestivum]|uniref:uncharacterized protein n=1 Tax=Triticum aestivum TaxID=4565 RepID=UPI001D0250F5|nr:uncharacterized protein LOC123142672 [Triticum aestivum]